MFEAKASPDSAHCPPDRDVCLLYDELFGKRLTLLYGLYPQKMAPCIHK